MTPVVDPVVIERRDLHLLLSAAALYLKAFTPTEETPRYEDVEAVMAKHGRWSRRRLPRIIDLTE